MNEPIIIHTSITAPVEKVWEYWTNQEHIAKWAHASDDWHAPSATNDLRLGGSFSTRMEAKDGTAGFDFGGTYTNVVPYERIEYVMGDGRKVQVIFAEDDGITTITETFDPESENPIEMQRAGWQAILDNFARYMSM